MPRRKRLLDDSDDSDSSAELHNMNNHEDDPDLREERELFENPYNRKRKRRDGKQDAIYGVFGDDSDDQDDYKPGSSRRHWTKAPAFVSSDVKVDLDKDQDISMAEANPSDEDVEDEDGEDVGSQGEDAAEVQDDSDYSESSRPPSPRVRLEDEDGYGEDDNEDSKPRTGGLGFKSAAPESDDTNMAFGAGAGGRGGIGGIGGIGARGGLGAKGGIGARGGIGAGAGIGAKRGIGVTLNESAGESVPMQSSSKGGIGAAKSLASAFSSSPSILKTVSLSEQESSASPSPAPVPATQNQDASTSFRSSASPAFDGMPTSFGRPQEKSRRFQPKTATTTPKPASLTPHEATHFSKISSTFGARMLSKMGWQAGAGLGVTGEGIVTPIESKLRPQKMGIAFKGFKEKTEQSKREAKRRGEEVSDDEDEKTKKMRRKVKEAEQKRSDIWKKPKKVKTKIEHKTYEQIISEAGQEPAVVGLGQIIDATGAVPKEVSSLSEVNLNSWAPTSDPTRIPEIRHNIRLIADACKSDLSGLAREGKALSERKKFVILEDARLRKKIEEEAELIARLQQIQLVANDISNLSKEMASVYEVSLEPFTPLVHKLVDQFAQEFDRYGLDEIVVAAIAPLVKRMATSWDPLKEPKEFISVFRGWRRALKVNKNVEEQEGSQVDVYGARMRVASPPPQVLAPMTPFESLLWNVWLPRVRSSINNEWSPEDAQPAVKLYEAWESFLPPFIRDNMLDQLILPKVQKAVADWNPKRSTTSLGGLVFPWLPYVGLRMEDLMSDAKRKVKSMLRTWVAGEDLPADLAAWRDVHDKGEWDMLILKYILPKLGNYLRTDFRIDPLNHKRYMPVFAHVLSWSPYIRPSILSQLLETEFFPEWLRILHIWLIQPTANLDEVSKWYEDWTKEFPPELRGYQNIERGFTRGLQLMHEAMNLGPSAPTKLKRPDYKKEMDMLAQEMKSKNKSSGKITGGTTAGPSAKRAQEITFKSIVEETAANHNLLLMPTGKAHAKSRMPLFKVSLGVDGKKGILVYILDDAVWASVEGGAGSEVDEFRAISLDEMVLRATSQ